MKTTITHFLAVIFILTASFSCKSDDDHIYVDYDTYPVVYDLKNQNFELFDGVYQLLREFNRPMYDSDVLLIYKQIGTTTNNAPVWQQIPITFYLNDGHELDYNFDFSKYDFVIYAGGTFDLTGTEFIHNQTFRVVVVPADFGKPNIDFSDYDSVINYYNIDDSNPIQL